MHPLIVELIRRIEQFHMPHEATDTALTVSPTLPDGYEVNVTVTSSEAVVTLGQGWHEHFSVPEDSEAVQQLFMLALTDAARLKVASRGDFEHAWTLETRVEDVWGGAGTTGLIFVPFWKRKRLMYRRNTHISVSALVPWIPERFLKGSAA